MAFWSLLSFFQILISRRVLTADLDLLSLSQNDALDIEFLLVAQQSAVLLPILHSYWMQTLFFCDCYNLINSETIEKIDYSAWN